MNDSNADILTPSKENETTANLSVFTTEEEDWISPKFKKGQWVVDYKRSLNTGALSGGKIIGLRASDEGNFYTISCSNRTAREVHEDELLALTDFIKKEK